MIKLPQLRIIVDPQANSGVWNMAVDETLLMSAINDDIATLRWYQWQEPTVSLGYFQNAHDLIDESRLAALPRVRRLSGGGTLVHDQEVTYSLCLPATQRIVLDPTDLYGIVHQTIIDVFNGFGIQMSIRGQTVRSPVEPVLCFSRKDEHDVILEETKVLGSAQRRRRGAILQHGGLLLTASKVTPELIGIENLTPITLPRDLQTVLGAKLGTIISHCINWGEMTTEELQSAQKLADLISVTT